MKLITPVSERLPAGVTCSVTPPTRFWAVRLMPGFTVGQASPAAPAGDG